MPPVAETVAYFLVCGERKVIGQRKICPVDAAVEVINQCSLVEIWLGLFQRSGLGEAVLSPEETDGMCCPTSACSKRNAFQRMRMYLPFFLPFLVVK